MDVPKGVEVQVLSWAPKEKTAYAVFSFGAQEARRLRVVREDLNVGACFASLRNGETVPSPSFVATKREARERLLSWAPNLNPQSFTQGILDFVTQDARRLRVVHEDLNVGACFASLRNGETVPSPSFVATKREARERLLSWAPNLNPQSFTLGILDSYSAREDLHNPSCI